MKVYKFNVDHVFIGHAVFVLIVKTIKMKNYLFVPNLCEIRKKNIEKKNCSFRKDLKISSQLFSHKSYTFSFIHHKSFYGNQKINIPAKIYEIWKKC